MIRICFEVLIFSLFNLIVSPGKYFQFVFNTIQNSSYKRLHTRNKIDLTLVWRIYAYQHV